jgi:hypothetical protein
MLKKRVSSLLEDLKYLASKKKPIPTHVLEAVVEDFENGDSQKRN